MSSPASNPDPRPQAPAPLSEAEVRKLARLAKLALTPEEIALFRTDLSSILGYADRLRALDLGDVEPMAHVGDTRTRLDADQPGPMLSNAAMMKLAPSTIPPFIHVPKVIGDGGGA